ncbi:MAG: haloacid dehalogenase-like hydrolase [Acidaminococcaceae bacterium]|uniref:HAD family hydrolase n=1 Tax=Succiniclasticum sp. TaxID=2775030 RepID=UPI001B00B750|nr:HAD family hydrolase [Succiniclasticum sp.]MBO5590278.1 haloacid dehalogenase-like hydrolase [Acidaminococcaceae bacterium]MBO5636728.1 haloacid dehalogenase-like hydrolase [Acidaminococcaceae bacterium]MBP3812477.1 haloacid dehalogenase-like hydrolase [Acidaminococcaceae bacterium]MBQ8492575.1 haloacid dehalogenase-like hydrolase [Acidaminococcaceae bacterium]MBR1494027.1 haloacid dehalogenase-like hydrolase [Acidaminococcaceae bacterium]
MASKPIIALMYDFDKTLCTTDMQAYTFIPNLGMSAEEFWQKASNLAEKHKMDRILAYMYLMLDEAHIHRKPIRRNDFVGLGKDLELYPGVTEWFGRINQFGKEQGVTIKHYIISSGLREIIEGSSIFKEFDDVFAGEFLYDENDVACWPKNVVNYTTKTQFLFRINKGVLDISNDDDLNRFTPEENRPVPFRNMIYIGDGLTDVPCMKLVKVNGGFSIAVYQSGKRAKVKDLIQDERVNFIEPADYSEGSKLDIITKDIILHMASVERLKAHTRAQLAAIRK